MLQIIKLAVELKKKILNEVDYKIVSKAQISQKYGIPNQSLLTNLKAFNIFGAKNTNAKS